MPPDAPATTQPAQPAQEPAAAPPTPAPSAKPSDDIGKRAVESAAAKAAAAEKEAQDAWAAAKEKAKTAPAAKLERHVSPDADELDPDERAAAQGGSEDPDDDTDGTEAAETKEGEKPAAEAAEPPKEEPKTEKPTSKEWNEFLRRKADTERKLKNRESRIVAREAEIVGRLEQREREATEKVQAAESRLSSLKLDSSDPWEVWQSLAAWKGWDLKEAFGTVTRRTLNGGELTVEDRLSASEKRMQEELRKRDEDIKKRDEEIQRRDAEAADARQQQENARLLANAHTHIAGEFKKAADAGNYKFIAAKYSQEQVARIAYEDIERAYIASCQKDRAGRPILTTGREIPLDKYLDGWEAHLKQDYERYQRALSSDGNRAGHNGSEPTTANGAGQPANPGTQQANGSPQRGPKTVTRSLAAQRSELNRPLSDAEEWEEAKRIAAQRTSAAAR